MKNYSVEKCIALLEENNHTQPKAKYSNNILINMLQCTTMKRVSVEQTKGGFELNRGSLCECLVKSALGQKGNKQAKGNADINLKGVDKKEYELPQYAKKLEVKFATSFAPATKNKVATKYVILVTDKGAYLIDTANHEGRFTRKSVDEGERLDNLSELLGF